MDSAGSSNFGGGLLVRTIVRANRSSVKTAAFSGSGHTLAIVAPDIILDGTVETLLEEVFPLRVLTVAIGIGTQNGVACGVLISALA